MNKLVRIANLKTETEPATARIRNRSGYPLGWPPVGLRRANVRTHWIELQKFQLHVNNSSLKWTPRTIIPWLHVLVSKKFDRALIWGRGKSLVNSLLRRNPRAVMPPTQASYFPVLPSSNPSSCNHHWKTFRTLSPPDAGDDRAPDFPIYVHCRIPLRPPL
jgi:hypothetical protein